MMSYFTLKYTIAETASIKFFIRSICYSKTSYEELLLNAKLFYQNLFKQLLNFRHCHSKTLINGHSSR